MTSYLFRSTMWPSGRR